MAFRRGPNIITDGLVAYFDAANPKSYPGSGTNWKDIVSNNDGTLTNGPTYSSDKKGKFIFDGTNDYVDGDLASNYITNTSGITVALWCRPDAVGVYKKIVTTGTPASVIQGIYFSIGPNPYNTYFGLRLSGTNRSVVSTTDLSTTEFNYLVGTYNGSTMKVYLNDTLLNSANYSGTIGTGGDLRISGYWNGNETWDGDIATCQFYNRDLSLEEIQQNYNNTKSRFGL